MLTKAVAIIKTGAKTWQVAGLLLTFTVDGATVGEYVLTKERHSTPEDAMRYAMLLEERAARPREVN